MGIRMILTSVAANLDTRSFYMLGPQFNYPSSGKDTSMPLIKKGLDFGTRKAEEMPVSRLNFTRT